jgi:hypothetical protein
MCARVDGVLCWRCGPVAGSVAVPTCVGRVTCVVQLHPELLDPALSVPASAFERVNTLTPSSSAATKALFSTMDVPFAGAPSQAPAPGFSFGAPTPPGFVATTITEDEEKDGEAANAGPPFHPLPAEFVLGGTGMPVVCVSLDAAFTLCQGVGVSFDKQPSKVFTGMCEQLLLGKGFPKGLVSKALEKHPRSALKAEQWLVTHRDLLMAQHDLLTGLSADVAASKSSQPQSLGFAFGSVTAVCVLSRCLFGLCPCVHVSSLLAFR